MAETESGPLDRLYALVAELLEEGVDPSDIKDCVRDATFMWAMARSGPRGAE